MSIYTTEITLGNGYEVGVEIDVLDYEPSYAGSWGQLPEDYDPGSQGYVSLGAIRASEEVEELGLSEGQEIDPAYLFGGRAALLRLELEALEEHEGSDGDYGYEEPDDYPDDDCGDYYEGP